MTFWTCYTDKTSKVHAHEFNEYFVCVYGKYTVTVGEKETVLYPGDEFFIQKGTAHGEKCVAGTRTIHAFWGKRV